MQCQHQLTTPGQYCDECVRLHKRCVAAMCTKLMGKEVTFTIMETNPLCKVMRVMPDPQLARTELRWRLTAARLRRTMTCNNVACSHVPTVSGGATVIRFDFCHHTARFKRWLCNNCNLALRGLADVGATITRAREAACIKQEEAHTAGELPKLRRDCPGEAACTTDGQGLLVGELPK